MICIPADDSVLSYGEVKWSSEQEPEHLKNNDVTRLEMEQKFRIKAEQEHRLKALYEAKTKMAQNTKNECEIVSDICSDQSKELNNQYSSPEEEYEARIRAEGEARSKAQFNSEIDQNNLRLEAEQRARIKAQQEARFKALYEAKLQKIPNHN